MIDGTAKKPALTLRSDPVLEQADIFALLLFGKPTTELGRGEKLDLQQQALNTTSGYVAAKIGESVSEALDLRNWESICARLILLVDTSGSAGT